MSEPLRLLPLPCLLMEELEEEPGMGVPGAGVEVEGVVLVLEEEEEEEGEEEEEEEEGEGEEEAGPLFFNSMLVMVKARRVAARGTTES